MKQQLLTQQFSNGLVLLGEHMPWLRSSVMPTAFTSAGAQKLGQPLPLSNLVSETKSSLPQPAQR